MGTPYNITRAIRNHKGMEPLKRKSDSHFTDINFNIMFVCM